LVKIKSKMTIKKILILPGDGIGPEVMNEALKLIKWVEEITNISFELTEGLVGGIAYDTEGDSISDKTMQLALSSDAVLFGAVGGPKWDKVERNKRPEAALLRLRKEMDLFANLRPAIVFEALLNASSLKSNLIEDLDILILRELTSGVYFGKPRGVEILENGQKKATDTQVYTTNEITRIAEVGFELAKKRSNKITSVEKANVMETGMYWRQVVTELHEKKYKEVKLNHMYADNCAMQLVKNPKQFDVIVTDNLFGDILSDCAAMLTGSLGMLPSASLGPIDKNGNRSAMYEPVHGSAPDITGEGKANPLAMIMSFGMMLKYSFDMNKESLIIKNAIQNVLLSGLRTFDINQDNKILVSTSDMGSAVIEELKKLSKN
tara:strand:+ start:154 stop:1287 length:1134 start_codon:yes stop_codon:yes gene_type:complete